MKCCICKNQSEKELSCQARTSILNAKHLSLFKPISFSAYLTKTKLFHFEITLISFQALADRLGIPCSLVRGDYGRAWNEVRLCQDQDEQVFVAYILFVFFS